MQEPPDILGTSRREELTQNLQQSTSDSKSSPCLLWPWKAFKLSLKIPYGKIQAKQIYSAYVGYLISLLDLSNEAQFIETKLILQIN